jgi:hypothetical protein
LARRSSIRRALLDSPGELTRFPGRLRPGTAQPARIDHPRPEFA